MLKLKLQQNREVRVLQKKSYSVLETEGPLEELSFTYVLLNIVKCKQHFRSRPAYYD